MYRQRVIQLGESPDRVKNVGAIGLDHIARTKLMSMDEVEISLQFELHKPYFLVTYHPVTLGDEPPEQSFQILLKALDEYSEYQVIITYPNADNGGREIISLIEAYAKNQPDRVLAVPSLGYKRYLSIVKNAKAVIGNSSSGIIEVPAFDVPTVNIGLRQTGRLAAKSVIHCKVQKSEIVDAIKFAVLGSYKENDEIIENPYGSGDASSQLVEMLKNLKFNPCKPFFDLK